MTHHEHEPLSGSRAADLSAADLDILVIAGGYGPDKLRVDEGVKALVRGMNEQGKPVSSRRPPDLPAFMRALLALAVGPRRPSPPAEGPAQLGFSRAWPPGAFDACGSR